MKIAHAQIEMKSSHILTKEHSKEETLRTWIGNARPDFENTESVVSSPGQGGDGDRLTLSETAMRRSLARSLQDHQTVETSQTPETGEDPKLTAMRLILEALTGKKIEISDPQGFQGEGDAVVQSSPAMLPPDQGGTERAGWGLEYEYHEVNAEHETMTFAAHGPVETTEGQHLEVTMELAMSRDFLETKDIQVRAGDAMLVDPLVVNFADQPVGLTGQKVAFDLNNDGFAEQISAVAPGSGLLFLDRNGDGRATDGTELFGPVTGSGFAELAALDADGNGWLDENDPMFDKLKLWIQEYAHSLLPVGTIPNGAKEGMARGDSVMSLKEVGIGAISLSHQATPFSLTDAGNQQRGQVTGSGLFLREDGRAGSIQEILLVV